MVSQTDKKRIAGAVAQAEHTTSAELVCVVAPASDGYQSYVFLYGLMLGSAIDLGLWMEKTVTFYPSLLAIQMAVISLLSLVPWLRHLCLKLVPKHVRHHRAAHRAFEEYLIVSRHVSSATPILLLYVSIAERYAHILPSRTVREHIPDSEWNGIIQTLTSSVSSKGLPDACIHAINQAAGLLATHFPKT